MNTAQKSFQIKKEAVKREWHVVDVGGKVLGRIATDIARLLMGKHKIDYTPHVDSGDYVVIVNAKAVEVTGNKTTGKVYYRHSQYPGGFKQETFDKLIQRKPTSVIEKAVYGMLPKNKQRDDRMRRLKVFVGPDHTYNDKIQPKVEKTQS